MLALAGACLFAACSDDDDDDSQIITSTVNYKGTSTASVMGMNIEMENDTVSVIPMAGSNPEMVKVKFAPRTMTVMGAISVVMDGFAIDSCVVSGTADDFTLSRKNNFAVKDVNVTLQGNKSAQTVIGKFTSASIKDGKLTLKLDDVKAHEQMPVNMSLTFEGQK